MQPDELTHVPADTWRMLAESRGAWRTPILASAAPGGGADARTVVLREVSGADNSLAFFTDRRSRKCAQLDVDAQVCLLVYDADRGLQVRLYGKAKREHDSAWLDKGWTHLGEHQRVHYATDVVAPNAGNEKSRENFAAFRVTVERFHCLWIHEEGNRAAEFTHSRDGWRGHPVRA